MNAHKQNVIKFYKDNTNMQPIPLQKDQDQAKAIFPTFRAWSSFSKKEDHEAMLALCQANSGFAEITEMCKRAGEIGIRYYYKFERLVEVSMLDEGKKALVTGDIELVQSGSGIVFTGQFQASCHSPIRLTTASAHAIAKWSDESAA
ncbi:MAG: hypothetical protein GXO89_06510 [Chlorobi bacterium]|nr:hypothetical protein [Chlorobiota bacterium]